MSERAVQWLHVSHYWDGPLEGWCRIDSTWCHFRWTEDDPADDSSGEYRLYLLDPETTLAELRHIRIYRHMVGWHSDCRPGEPPRGTGYFDEASHPNWRQFYDLHGSAELDLDRAVRVGTMAPDRRTARMVPEWDDVGHGRGRRVLYENLRGAVAPTPSGH